jgi:ATP-dependent DNA ligase
VKFDGYRCQPHKTGEEAIIFSKNGRDFTNRAKLGGLRTRTSSQAGQLPDDCGQRVKSG